MRRIIWTILFCFIGLTLGIAGPALCAVPGDLSVSPDVMKVDTFFSGGQVTIAGEIPGSDQLAIEVVGPQATEQYDLKGRVGPFWMTREKIRLENAPLLYGLLLPEGRNWEEKAAALGLGVENLKNQITFGRADVPKDDIFKMFVELKSEEGLYKEMPGAISYAPGKNGDKRFTATYRLPSSVSAGQYTIRAIAVDHGARDLVLTRDMTVEQVGFIKMVNELASDRRLTYGISAVVIALVAGSLMGVISKSHGSH